MYARFQFSTRADGIRGGIKFPAYSKWVRGLNVKKGHPLDYVCIEGEKKIIKVKPVQYRHWNTHTHISRRSQVGKVAIKPPLPYTIAARVTLDISGVPKKGFGCGFAGRALGDQLNMLRDFMSSCATLRSVSLSLSKKFYLHSLSN